MASTALKAGSMTNPLDWKTPVYSQFAAIGLSIVIFAFLPESPCEYHPQPNFDICLRHLGWLVSKGRTEKARKVLVNKFKNVEGYNYDGEIAIMASTIETQRLLAIAANAEGPFAMLKGLNLKRFLIGSWPKVLQQFVGLAIFSSFSAYFFRLAGNNDPFMATVILGTVALGAVFIDAILVDRIGRRKMTLIGFTGACSGVTLMAIVGCLDYETPQLGAVLVFAGVIANFFNSFQSSTSYAYLTEMPEQRFKARATGWGLAYCNLYAVLLNFTLPLMLDIWKVKAAFFFVVLGIP